MKMLKAHLATLILSVIVGVMCMYFSYPLLGFGLIALYLGSFSVLYYKWKYM